MYGCLPHVCISHVYLVCAGKEDKARVQSLTLDIFQLLLYVHLIWFFICHKFWEDAMFLLLG